MGISKALKLFDTHALRLPIDTTHHLGICACEIKPHIDRPNNKKSFPIFPRLPYFFCIRIISEYPHICKAHLAIQQSDLSPRSLQCVCHDSTEPSMSNTAEDTRPGAPNSVNPITSSPTGFPRHGHESLIAQPSTFLLPRGQPRAMTEKPLTALDKDQQQGLVSAALQDLVVGGVWERELATSFRTVRGVGTLGTPQG
jgi:hypothetical protein